MVLYFAIFPYPLGKELVARPAWAVDLTSTSSNTAAGGPQTAAGAGTAPFRLGELFGYVTSDGKLVHLERSLFQTALSSAGYINYTRVGTDWIMRDPLGERLLAFSGTGYPLLSPDGRRVLLVSPDLTGLTEVDANGDTVWSRDFPAIMTCASLQGDYLLVGLLNGSLQLLGRRGTPLYQGHSPASRIPAIYGCTVAHDGSFVALVSGIEPQVLTVLEKSGSSYSGAVHEALATDFRREVRMGFSPDSRYLWYEDGRGVGLLEPGSGRFASLGLAGRLAGSAFLRGARLAAFAAREAGLVDLRITVPFVADLSSESFPARELFLGDIDGQLLLGVDGRLLRIDVEAL